MEYQKPSRQEVSQNTVEARKLIISFVPDSIDSKYTTKDWANQFSIKLNMDKRNENFSTLNYFQAGTHKNAQSRISGSYTDFLVVFTADYATAPPEELNKVINEVQDLQGKTNLLMWLAQYEADSYKNSRLDCKYIDWHVLKGKGKDGERFKTLEESGWKDDITDAVRIIHGHPSCENKSPICPKQQSSNTNEKSEKSVSFISKLRNFLHNQP